jgi:hypothetical protein
MAKNMSQSRPQTPRSARLFMTSAPYTVASQGHISSSICPSLTHLRDVLSPISHRLYRSLSPLRDRSPLVLGIGVRHRICTPGRNYTISLYLLHPSLFPTPQIKCQSSKCIRNRDTHSATLQATIHRLIFPFRASSSSPSTGRGLSDTPPL